MCTTKFAIHRWQTQWSTCWAHWNLVLGREIYTSFNCRKSSQCSCCHFCLPSLISKSRSWNLTSGMSVTSFCTQTLLQECLWPHCESKVPSAKSSSPYIQRWRQRTVTRMLVGWQMKLGHEDVRNKSWRYLNQGWFKTAYEMTCFMGSKWRRQTNNIMATIFAVIFKMCGCFGWLPRHLWSTCQKTGFTVFFWYIEPLRTKLAVHVPFSTCAILCSIGNQSRHCGPGSHITMSKKSFTFIRDLCKQNIKKFQ